MRKPILSLALFAFTATAVWYSPHLFAEEPAKPETLRFKTKSDWQRVIRVEHVETRMVPLSGHETYREYAVVRYEPFPFDQKEVPIHGKVIARYGKIFGPGGNLKHIAHLGRGKTALHVYTVNLDHEELSLENLRASYDQADSLDFHKERYEKSAPFKIGYCAIDRRLLDGHRVEYDGLTFTQEDGDLVLVGSDEKDDVVADLHRLVSSGLCHVNFTHYDEKGNFVQDVMNNSYYLDKWTWNMSERKDVDMHLEVVSAERSPRVIARFNRLLGTRFPLTMKADHIFDNEYTQPKTCYFRMEYGKRGDYVEDYTFVRPLLRDPGHYEWKVGHRGRVFIIDPKKEEPILVAETFERTSKESWAELKSAVKGFRCTSYQTAPSRFDNARELVW